MKQIYPDYYKDFKCTAGACAHNCCIGWEIDIDDETLKYYRSVGGEMGERLKRSISGGGEPHFILGEGERCPFLNENDLCDIILTLGEIRLCGICTDHPRFRSFLSDRTETGLGLCCEEAARLILSHREPMRLVTEGGADAPEATSMLLKLREQLFSIVWQSGKSLNDKSKEILDMCAAEIPEKTLSQWADFYLSLERLDEKWTALLEQLRDMESIDFAVFYAHMSGRMSEHEQLLGYFIFRHFMTAEEDGDVSSKAAFAVLSVGIICALGAVRFTQTGDFTLEDQVELARLYSSEIEYSQENMDALFDELCL